MPLPPRASSHDFRSVCGVEEGRRDESLYEAGGALQGVGASSHAHTQGRPLSAIADALVVSGSSASSLMGHTERERMGMGPLVSIEDEADLAAGRRLTSARHAGSRHSLLGGEGMLSPHVRDFELAQALGVRSGGDSCDSRCDGPWTHSVPSEMALPARFAQAAATGTPASTPAQRETGSPGGAGPPPWERHGSSSGHDAFPAPLGVAASKGGTMSEKERALLAQIQKLEGQLAKEKIKKKVCAPTRRWWCDINAHELRHAPSLRLAYVALCRRQQRLRHRQRLVEGSSCARSTCPFKSAARGMAAT